MEKKIYRFISGGCFAIFALIYLYLAIQYHYDFWNWLIPLGFLAVTVGIFIGKYLITVIGAGVSALGMMYILSRTLGQLGSYGLSSGPILGNILVQFLRCAAFALVAVAALMAFLSKPKLRKLGMIFGFAAAGVYFIFLVVILIRGSHLLFRSWVLHLTFIGGAALLGLAINQIPDRSAVPAAAAPQPMYYPPQQPQPYQQPFQPAYQQPAQPQWQAPVAAPVYQPPQYQAPPVPSENFAAPTEPVAYTPPAESQAYAPAAEPQAYAPPAEPPQYQPPVQAPVYQPAAPQPAAMPYDFSGVRVRYRCTGGHVFDGEEGLTACPTCGAALPAGGFIQLYRMGNPMGAAVGMGVYIDDTPFGHLATKQSIRISVPYGPHKVHVTHTSTRKCNDPVYTVTPEYPYAWCKAHFTKGGFAIEVEQADPSEMPTR